MKVNQHYGSVIWTNHALDRLRERRLPQEIAYKAFMHPDNYQQGKNKGTWEYRKTIDGHLITLVAKQNEHRQWIIVSCWADPPYAGSIDSGKKELWREYQKAGLLKKFWMTFLKQCGLLRW